MRPLFSATMRRPTVLRNALARPITAVIVAATLCILLAACAGNPSAPPTPDYSATVAAALPTADPTVPPTPTATTEPTNSPEPTATLAPTYTPRPAPTYTPHPTPTKATSDERQPAVLFSARMLDGTDLVLSDTFGSPTLLAFWAPW